MSSERLVNLLREISGILHASGAAAAEKDVLALMATLETGEKRPVEEVLADLERRLDPSSEKTKLIARHASALIEADLDERKFATALEAIRQDKKLDKADVAALAKGAGVIRIEAKSRASAVDSIEKHFYWRLYNRDADAMAKRATPW